MGFVFGGQVEELFPDVVLAAVVYVVCRSASEFLDFVLEVFYEFAVSVGIGNIVAVSVVVLDAASRVGEYVGHEGHAAAVLDGVDGSPLPFVPQRAVVVRRLDPGLIGAQVFGDASTAWPSPAPVGGIGREFRKLERGIVVAGAIEQLGLGYQFVIEEQAVSHEASGLRVALPAADPDGIAAGAGRDFHVAIGELALVVVGVEDGGVAAGFQVGGTGGPAGLLLDFLQCRHQDRQQQGDDGNHHQKFNQCEADSSTHCVSPCV